MQPTAAVQRQPGHDTDHGWEVDIALMREEREYAGNIRRSWRTYRAGEAPHEGGLVGGVAAGLLVQVHARAGVHVSALLVAEQRAVEGEDREQHAGAHHGSQGDQLRRWRLGAETCVRG